MAQDAPTPEPEPRRTDKWGDDELMGMVFMSGDEVAWAGPMAVLGQQQEDDEDGTAGEDDEDMIATGEDYTPPEPG